MAGMSKQDTAMSTKTLTALNDARVIQVEVLDGTLVVVSFSNGDAIALKIEKLKKLALSEGSLHVSAVDAGSGF